MAESPVGLTVGPIELTANATSGVDWALLKLEGWYEGADISAPNQDRPTSPGQFAQAGRPGGKAITVNGEVWSKDRVFLTDAMETISATLADGSFAQMTVYDEDMGYRWAMVQRVGRPSFDPDDEPDVLKFQLQFFAPDAYRYGQTSAATAGFAAASGSGMVFPLFNPAGFMSFGALPGNSVASVQNPGTAPSSPVFAVTGPTPTGGFVIIDRRTGKRITFLGSVPEGMTLTLDASDGSVLLEGVADR